MQPPGQIVGPPAGDDRAIADREPSTGTGTRSGPPDARTCAERSARRRHSASRSSQRHTAAVRRPEWVRVAAKRKCCCGLAGNIGFEAGHYDVSMACAARQALLPAVRSADPGTLVLADGFSCRTQIEQGGTGRRAMHLACREATPAYFDPDVMQYQDIPVTEQAEVLSLLGDIAVSGGTPALHAHAVMGLRDGSTVGGHLRRAVVWPTLEVIVTESPAHLRKRVDEETGLALIALEESG
jgi:uncharacterized protein